MARVDLASGAHILNAVREDREGGQYWRTALLNGALRVITVVALGVAFFAWFPTAAMRWVFVTYLLVAAACVFADARQSLGYHARALILVVGLHLLWSVPLIGLGTVMHNASTGFLLEAMLATLLFDRRAGLWTVVAGVLSFVLAWWLQLRGVAMPRSYDWERTLDVRYLDVALRVMGVATGTSIAGVMAISHLVRRLELAVSERDASLLHLEKEHAARIQVLRELEQHEADFLRARELAVLGRLAGYVAHDFNNALLAIVGSAELIRRAQNGRERDDALAILDSAATQATSTVKQLRAFGPQPKHAAKPLDPRRVVRSLERMLRTLLPKNIALVVDLDEGPMASVLCDEGLLQSALMNLALNAWDAMRDGGQLVMRVHAADCDVMDAEHAEHSVVIEVQDSGVGMDEATQARVFAPFFTTKDSHGTGLGLASVRDTVEGAQGTVTVQSALGHGTRVRLCLPAVSSVPATQVTQPPVSGALHGNVLVVEDDPAVLRAVATYLRRRGLSVLEAPSAAEALQLAEERAVDVVVTDCCAPGGRVASFLHELRKAAPKVRVVLCSDSDPDAFEAARDLADVTLSKPFELETLVSRLRNLIAAHEATSA